MTRTTGASSQNRTTLAVTKKVVAGHLQKRLGEDKVTRQAGASSQNSGCNITQILLAETRETIKHVCLLKNRFRSIKRKKAII